MTEQGPAPPGDELAGAPAKVPWSEAWRAWLRVAALSFGGPAGQIAVMQRILVEEKRWVSQGRFLHALNYCMLLPGPEAQQLATYLGWLFHRTLGGLVAGLLFILPGFLSILVLSVLYAGFSTVPLVEALFFGLKPAVLAVVLEALLRLGRRALDHRDKVLVAFGAFVAIFLFDVAFPWIVAAAAGVGLLLGRRWRSKSSTAEMEAEVAPARPSGLRSLRVAVVWLLIWLAPLFVLAWALGPDHVLVEQGRFFSQVAVVTFGGAYAVLSYVGQRAVEDFAWLTPTEMLDGLGLAETTPGPLIQVVQFVAFLGAYRQPGDWPPLLAGVLGSIVTTWAIFAPSFLWIFLGAPYVEWLRGVKALSDALSAITAAVVGVILNLSVWFALHTLFAAVGEIHLGPLRLWRPLWQTLDPASLTIAIAACVALFRWKLGMLPTLAAAALVGMAWHWLR